MPSIDKLTRRQLSIGMADWFRPYAESIAPFNQIEVDAGVFFNKGTQATYLKTTAQASTPPFGLVGPGTYRYDLVYLDELGVPRSFPGTAQALPIVPWTGAPGQPGYAGPSIPANAFPIAYVLVDEVGAVIVIEADITDIRANFAQTQMAVAGDLVADGVAAVGANLKRLGASHVHPLNTDLVLPTQTSKYGPSVPGASGVYADRAHQHQEDAVLAGEVDALIAGAVTYMERSETLEFTVDDANPTQACRLHQFQGRMIDAATLLPAPLWANIQPAVPLTMAVGLGAGPGRGDSLNPAPGVDLVYYVYLIYKTVGAVWSLVYSQRPPTVGPDLSNPVLFGGYTHFRFGKSVV